MNKTHQRIQKAILQSLPGAVLEKRFNEIGRIADVACEKEKVVFEVQFSPMHPIEARERTRDYALIGYRVIWILHENMFNPLRPTPFQKFLSHFPHLYTNIDELLGGEIYSVKVNGTKVDRAVVDLNTFALKRSFALRWKLMKKFYKVCALAILSSQTHLQASCDATWSGSVSSDWDNTSNWNGCVPSVLGDTANFDDTSSNQTVNLTQPILIPFSPTLTNLNIFASRSYTISNPTGSASITFDGTNPQMTISQGNQTLDAPINLNVDTAFNVDGILKFTNNGTVVGSSTLTFNGGGTVNSQSSNLSPEFLVLQGPTINNSNEMGQGSQGIVIESGTINESGGNFGEGAVNLTINGGAVNVYNGAEFGNNLSGTFTINGGELTVGDFNSNSDVGHSSAIQMFGGTLLIQDNSNFGQSSPSIDVEAGTVTITDSSNFGSDANTITFANATLNSTQGYFGAGSATIDFQNASIVNTQNSIIGGTSTSMTMTNVTLQNSQNSSVYFQTLTLSSSTVNQSDYSQFGQNADVVTLENNSLINSSTNSYLFQNTNSVTLTGGSVINLNSSSTMGPLNLQFSGGTLNNNGTVNVGYNTHIPTITLGSSDVITGNGTFSGSNYSLINGGTVIPGSVASPGVLFLDSGSYIQLPTGTLVINAGGGLVGELSSNTASLDGTLKVNALPNFTLNSSGIYTIVSAPGGVTGKFSQVQFLNFPSGLIVDVVYDPTSVFLEVVPVLTGFMGHFYTMTFSSVNQVNFFVFRHLDWIRDRFLQCPCDPCVRKLRMNLYAGPIGSVGSIKSHKEMVGINYNTQGAIAGIDCIFKTSAAGIEVDFQRFNGRGAHHFGTVDTDHLHFNAYGTYSPIVPLSFSLLLGGGEDWINFKRNTTIDAPASAKATASLFDALIGAEYTINLSYRTSFTPLAFLQYISMEVDPFTESGGALFNNRYDRIRFDSLRSTVGFELAPTFYCFTPTFNVAWQHDYSHRNRTLFATSVNSGISQSLTAHPLEMVIDKKVDLIDERKDHVIRIGNEILQALKEL